MRVIFTLVLISIFSSSLAQRYAVASGNWSAAIWASTPTGLPGSASIPNSSHDVYTNGFVVIVNGSRSCRNLFIEYDVENGLSFSGTTSTLTVNGTLASWDSNQNSYSLPIVDIVQNDGNIVFTGANVTLIPPYITYFWDADVADFCTMRFNFGANNSFSLHETVNVGSTGNGAARQFRVMSGTLVADPGVEIRGSTNTSLAVDAGASIETDSPINGGSSGLTLYAVTLNGTIITSSYINASRFNVGSTGVLETSFSGTDQTEGWWYQSNRPSGGTLNAASTVNFSADANQNIYSRSYGNLILSGSNTKSIVGTAGMRVNGDLTIDNGVTFSSGGPNNITLLGNVLNDGQWAPPQLVSFRRSGNQAISGNMISFNGGLDIGTSSIATILNLQTDIDVNSLMRIFPPATLNLFDFDVYLSGNLTNNGAILHNDALLSSFIFDGTSSVGGSVPPTFPSILITGSLNAPSTSFLVAGNFTNNGSFNANSGTVIFNGSVDQTVAGVTTFNNVQITNTSANGVSPSGTMNLLGTLTLTGASRFNANGNLVVLSTGVNSGGRIAELPTPGSFTGNVTIQRFINSPAGWRYLSIPVQGATVETLRDDPNFPVTGRFSDPSPADADVQSSTASSLYYWRASTQSWVSIGPGLTTPMGSTPLSNRGYNAYSYRNYNVTLSFSGQIYKGDVSVPLNNGLNLVPNPFPSAIDWDVVYTTNSGIASGMSIRAGDNVVSSYIFGAPAVNPPFPGWTGEVAIGQSFWMESQGASAINFQEVQKTGGSFEFLRKDEPENYIRLTLASPTQKDETVIWFPKGATNEFDPQFDVGKRQNGCETCEVTGYMNFSSFNGDPQQDFAINGLPRVEKCNSRVGLRIRDVAPGTYTMKITELDKLYLGYAVKLIDHLANHEMVATEGMEYEFTVTEDSSSYGSDRFEIEISAAPFLNTSLLPSFSDLKECNGEDVKVKLIAPQSGVNYQLWSEVEPVTEQIASTGTDIIFAIKRGAVQPGLNLFTLRAATADGCASHDFTNVLEYYFEEPTHIKTVTDGQACGEGMVTLRANGAPADGHYNWYESAEAVDPIYTSADGTFNTPSLHKSKIYFVSAVNGSGCESARSQVAANIVYVDLPIITADGERLVSSTGPSYQWYKDGEILINETTQSLQATESGDYTVNVTSEGCEATSESVSIRVAAETDLAGMGVRVYPNPIASALMITMPPDFARQVTRLTVLDSKGAEVIGISDKVLIDSGEVTVDFDEKPSGNYILNIVSGKKIIALRLIKK